MTDLQKPRPLEGQVLPKGARSELKMPDGTPLGFGFLGAMKFAAIRRVIEERERTLRALADHADAEGAANEAYARLERTRAQLQSLDVIRDDERNRLQFAHNDRLRQEEAAKELAELARLKLKLERLETEEKVAQVEDRMRRWSEARDKRSEQSAEYEAIVGALKEYPGMVAAAEKVKADISKSMGEDADGLADALAAVDAFVTGAMAKRAEGLVT